MVVIDEAGLIRDFSKTAERLFGWKPEETFGRNVSMLMPAPYREEHDSYLHRYYDTGERRIIGLGRVVVGERRDGSTFRWNCRSARCGSTASATSPALSATSPSDRKPRRGCRNCRPSWSTSRG